MWHWLTSLVYSVFPQCWTHTPVSWDKCCMVGKITPKCNHTGRNWNNSMIFCVCIVNCYSWQCSIQFKCRSPLYWKKKFYFMVSVYFPTVPRKCIYSRNFKYICFGWNWETLQLSEWKPCRQKYFLFFCCYLFNSSNVYVDVVSNYMLERKRWQIQR